MNCNYYLLYMKTRGKRSVIQKTSRKNVMNNVL